MRRLVARPAWPLLLFALVSTACALPEPVAPPRPALALAPSLTTCRPRPPVPVIEQDADLMLWVLDLDEAGEDCRQRLARVREVSGPVDRQ